MFTQRDEEKYILKFFGKKLGRFLDIGAHDGECFSTTRALAIAGWCGVCVEPSPSVYPVLEKRYKDNMWVKTIPVAISNTTGDIDFYDCGGDMVSTIDINHVKLWETKGGCKFKKIKVKSMTMLDLLNITNYNFDFISLDVEATNIQILRQFPMKRFTQLKMMCIEFDHQEEKVLQFVKPYGFKLYHRTAENLLLVRE